MKTTKILLISFVTNAFLSLIKIVFGILSKCNSLIADGFHSLSDLSTDIIAIFGNYLSLKPADDEHPFGHGKTEYITSLIISIIILLVGFILIYESFNKQFIIPNLLIILVSIFTIISKYILSTYIYKNGLKYENNILIASGKESKTDVYSSVFVLFSIVLMQFSNEIYIFKYADLIGTIVIAIFIIKTGYNILADNVSSLLEEQVLDEAYINKIKDIILSFQEVIELRSLYILRYGPYYKLISDIEMEENILLSDAHAIVDEMEKKLRKYDKRIKYVFIHMEPI